MRKFLQTYFTALFVILCILSSSPAMADEINLQSDLEFKCLRFDGINDVINLGDIGVFNNSQFFTVEMWVRIDTFSAWRTFFCKFQDFDNRIQFQEYNEPGKIALCVNNKANTKKDGNQAYFYTPRAEVTIGDWFHLAMVFDGTKTEDQRLKLYINGLERQLQKEASAKGTIPTHIPITNTPLLLGAEKATGAYGYKGLMDEVRIWTVARSDSEIRNNMDCTLKGNETGLQVYYQMIIDSSSKEILADQSVNHHPGRLVNFDLRSALTDRDFDVPASAASAIDMRKISPDMVTVSWTRGSGSANAVFISSKEVSSPHTRTGFSYKADSVYRKGSMLDTDEWYCVYNGYGASTTVSGLSPSTTYRLAIVDYNGISGKEHYRIDSSATLTFTTEKAVKLEKKSQSITFTLPDEALTGSMPCYLNATSSSGLPVVYFSNNENVALIAGDSLRIIGPGTVEITASQAGNDTYSAAADVIRILKVNPAKVVISEMTVPQYTAPEYVRKSLRKSRPFIIIAGTAIVTGVTAGILIGTHKSSGSGDNPVIDRPPNDPVLGAQ